MAVVVTQEFEATREEYDAVSEKIGDAPEPGLIVHTVHRSGNGKWRARRRLGIGRGLPELRPEQADPDDRRGESGRAAG